MAFQSRVMSRQIQNLSFGSSATDTGGEGPSLRVTPGQKSSVRSVPTAEVKCLSLKAPSGTSERPLTGRLLTAVMTIKKLVVNRIVNNIKSSKFFEFFFFFFTLCTNQLKLFKARLHRVC